MNISLPVDILLGRVQSILRSLKTHKRPWPISSYWPNKIAIRTRLQRHSVLACLEITLKNEAAINSTRNMIINNAPFAVHYDKIRNHLRETATNSAEIHSLAREYEDLRINRIQLRFLHFNQHSITLLGIHMGHWAYKREKYTFINANIKVINTILKVNRDNWHTLKCKHYSLKFLWHCLQFNSIPGQP